MWSWEGHPLSAQFFFTSKAWDISWLHRKQWAGGMEWETGPGGRNKEHCRDVSLGGTDLESKQIQGDVCGWVTEGGMGAKVSVRPNQSRSWLWPGSHQEEIEGSCQTLGQGREKSGHRDSLQPLHFFWHISSQHPANVTLLLSPPGVTRVLGGLIQERLIQEDEKPWGWVGQQAAPQCEAQHSRSMPSSGCLVPLATPWTLDDNYLVTFPNQQDMEKKGWKHQ